MKNSGSLTSTSTLGSIALAIALAAGLTSIASAQEKGATKLLQARSSPAASVETATMFCPKCKDTLASVTEKSPKTGAKADTFTVARHECPTCKHTLTASGHGKAAVTKLTQVCKESGSADAACCAMKKAN